MDFGKQNTKVISLYIHLNIILILRGEIMVGHNDIGNLARATHITLANEQRRSGVI